MALRKQLLYPAFAKCTFISSEAAGEAEEFESVGGSLPNFSTYILNESGNPVPLGFPGEIYIGGPSVSPGYSHNKALNQQKFLHNPFATQIEKELGWDRLYRSGDRGRLLGDGSLVPMGRIDGDEQTKLRGMRVELGSIESSILTTARGVIRDAVVVERGQPSFLVGFVTFVEKKRHADPDSFFRALIEDLPEPEYMRPTVIIPLEIIPQGSNEKIDRDPLKKLVVDRNPKTQVTDKEPLSATEIGLSQFWRSLLFENEVTPLNIYKDTDFFSVGGTSLLLVELQSLIKEAFNVNIELRELFQTKSLHGMASMITVGIMLNGLPASIDWTEETNVSGDLLKVKKLLLDPGSSHKTRIALTGAFGFLGKTLLRNLVQSASISTIHYLAVRQKSNSPSRVSSVLSDKIKIYSGDLSEDLLGLSQPDFEFLSRNVDVFIHHGAEVSFLKSYSDLRAPNVSSTKSLVKLSLPCGLPIHFISTSEIAQLTHMGTPLQESMPSSALSEPREGTDCYVASKWASERYLENAAESLGLEVYIHRPTYIFEASNIVAQ